VTVVQYTFTHKHPVTVVQYTFTHKHPVTVVQYTFTHKQCTEKINLGRVRAVSRLCELYPGIYLTTEEKARKNLNGMILTGETEER
jgi:hypothetical protein